MALSIGVVEGGIRYLERPARPIYTFMWALMEDPLVGLSGNDLQDDFFWDGGGNGESALYQFDKDSLEKRAVGWASQQGLTSEERVNLINWLQDLPCDEETGVVTLHLSF